jgi:hypothetical protein
VALFPGTNFNYFGSQQNTDDADEWNNVPQDSTISFDPSSLDKSAGNFGGQYRDVALDPGQFARAFAQKISQGYGAVDRALGGVLPGGADSPYIGASTTAAGRKGAVDAASTWAVDAALPLANKAALALVDRAQKNPAAQISLQTLNDIRQRVSNTLGKDVVAYVGPKQYPHFDPSDEFSKGPAIALRPSTPTTDLGIMLYGSKPQNLREFENTLVHSPIALHELGHALNTGDPFANRLAESRNMDINRFTGYSRTPNYIAGIGAATSDKNGNKSLLASGIQGALEYLAAPGTRHTLAEEALASRNAINLADEFNLPRGIPGLGAAFGTYATSRAMPGFTTGVASELVTRGARAFGNAIGDYIIDPIGDRIRGNDYNPLEQQLRKYGYNEKDYRLAQPGGFGAPVQVQHK